MAQRKSFMDDQGLGSIGTPKAKAGKKNESAKLILAVLLFLVAGAVGAWASGVFDGPIKPTETITPEQQQAQQAQQQKVEQATKANKGITGGTD